MKPSASLNPHPLELDELATRLRAIVTYGRETALRREHPLLVSLTVECSAIPPLSIFHAARFQTRIFWHQQAENLAMVGTGLTVSYETSGESRFEQMRTAHGRLISETHVDACTSYPLRAPVALGGFAFDPAAPPNPAWENHPDALLVVPRFLFLTANDASWCTINLQMSADTVTDAVVQEVLDELEELSGAIDEPVGGEQPALWATTDDTGRLWADKVNSILRGIQEGRIEKVVLARELRLRGGDEIDVDIALRRLTEISQHCVLFAIDTAAGCMLGATPERLVRLQGQNVEVDCLAGSTARGDDEDSDCMLAKNLLCSDKDRREHGWVVEHPA